jgi:hypothetical protein
LLFQDDSPEQVDQHTYAPSGNLDETQGTGVNEDMNNTQDSLLPPDVSHDCSG